jgi:hypothetical protein
LLLPLFAVNNCNEPLPPPTNEPLPSLISTPFSEDGLAPYRGKGTASISGSAFLVREESDTLHEEGALVLLVPVSEYTKEWFDKFVIQDGECRNQETSTERTFIIYFFPPDRCTLAYAIALDNRIMPYIRNTKTDAAGRFALVNLPPGEYFIAVRIGSALAHSRVRLSNDQQLTNIEVSRKLGTKSTYTTQPE